MANAALTGMAYLLISHEPELLQIITSQVMGVVMLSVLLFGAIITTLCALVSINKYLRMKVSELYYK